MPSHPSPRFQIGQYWLSQRKQRPNYYATWYDTATGQTRRASLGTGNLENAKQALAQFVVNRGELRHAPAASTPISALFARYYHNHARHIPSADVTRRALNTWLDFYGDATVTELTLPRQNSFIEWLQQKGLKASTIRRTLVAGKTALNYAYKAQEIDSVPHIKLISEGSHAKPPLLSIHDSAALFNACTPGDNLFLFLIISYNTLARPAAVLQLTPAQVDLQHRLINLLPLEQTQTKKRRPTLPITNTLYPWLIHCTGPTYIHHNGSAIANNKKAFNQLKTRARLPAITRYSIRHTMATELARASVSEYERAGWLAHSKHTTTASYTHYDPNYLHHGKRVLDDYFARLQSLVSYPLKLAATQNRKAK